MLKSNVMSRPFLPESRWELCQWFIRNTLKRLVILMVHGQPQLVLTLTELLRSRQIDWIQRLDERDKMIITAQTVLLACQEGYLSDAETIEQLMVVFDKKLTR